MVGAEATSVAGRLGPASRRSRGRLRMYSRAAMFAVLVAFVISVAGGSGGDAASGRLGGDFPAFYAAGSIVAAGEWSSLYDPDHQLLTQQALFADSQESFLYFAYPPHVAALYRPLAALDYRLAYTVHTVVMAGLLVAALALLRPIIGVLQRHMELAVIAALLFYPMLRAVTGGQNTALTVLLIAGAWRGLHDDNDVAAGLALGLLLYKPQFAIPLLGLLLLTRRWRAVGAGAATGLALWGIGVAAMGPTWLGSWWSDVSGFVARDADVNGFNAVSFLGFAEGLFGAGSSLALALAVPLMVFTAVALAGLWARLISTDLNTCMAAAVVGVVLMSPHAMFYDVGVLVLAGVVAADRLGRRAMLPIVAVWALAWSQFLGEAIGFAPLFLIVVLAAAWFVGSIVRPAELQHRRSLHAT